MRLAAKFSDVNLEAVTHGRAAMMHFNGDRWNDGFETIGKAMELAPETTNDVFQNNNYHWGTVYELIRGKPDSAAALAGKCLEAGFRTGSRGRTDLGYQATVWSAMSRGAWDEAVAAIRAWTAKQQRFPTEIQLEAWINAQIGNESETLKLLDNALTLRESRGNNPQDAHQWGCVALQIAWFMSDQDLMHRSISRLCDPALPLPTRPSELRFYDSARAMAAVVENDAVAAKEFLVSLSRVAGSPAIMAWWGFVQGDRLLALLARTAGDSAAANSYFEQAVGFCRNGLKPELAWTSADYADFLTDRDAPGDREKATELQDEAISIARDLGMKPLLERVLAKREILKA